MITYMDLLRNAMDNNDLTPLTKEHKGMTLAVSPHVGWFADMVTLEGAPTALEREEWVAVEESVAFYAAWLDANVLRITKVHA